MTARLDRAPQTSARSDPRTGATTWSPLTTVLNLVSLGLLTWGVTQEAHLGLQGKHLAALVLLIVSMASWLAWVAVRSSGSTPVAGVVAQAVLALAGGALVAASPLAVVFPAVAALGTAVSSRWQVALLVTGGGWIAMTVSVAATGHTWSVLFGGVAASWAGLAIGVSRREVVERAEQSVLLGVERERAEIERERAELLADRNHLARELHDVLAHTLSALSLQLEALDTIVASDPQANMPIRQQLDKSRTLVHEGLDEARGAVRALREDAPPLTDQLAQLCRQHDAHLSVEGDPRQLSPQVSLSLYRTAQEAITNAVKHAPGGAISVSLNFDPDWVKLDVENGRAARASSELAATGGGYGLQGTCERLALIGGTLQAGPTVEGWRVSAEVAVEP